MRASYEGRQAERIAQFCQQLQQLREASALDAREAGDATLRRLVPHLMLIGRSWIAEAKTSYEPYPLAAVVAHYQGLIADLPGRWPRHKVAPNSQASAMA